MIKSNFYLGLLSNLKFSILVVPLWIPSVQQFASMFLSFCIQSKEGLVLQKLYCLHILVPQEESELQAVKIFAVPESSILFDFGAVKNFMACSFYAFWGMGIYSTILETHKYPSIGNKNQGHSSMCSDYRGHLKSACLLYIMRCKYLQCVDTLIHGNESMALYSTSCNITALGSTVVAKCNQFLHRDTVIGTSVLTKLILC